VNRLTKIVHFNPLGIETAREILGKLIEELNERLAVAAVYDRRKLPGKDDAKAGKPATVIDRRYSVRVQLDESAMELILRKGFSEEYGARNLERVVDELLSGPLADEILGNEFNGREVILVSADEMHLKLERMEGG